MSSCNLGFCEEEYRKRVPFSTFIKHINFPDIYEEHEKLLFTVFKPYLPHPLVRSTFYKIQHDMCPTKKYITSWGCSILFCASAENRASSNFIIRNISVWLFSLVRLIHERRQFWNIDGIIARRQTASIRLVAPTIDTGEIIYD